MFSRRLLAMFRPCLKGNCSMLSLFAIFGVNFRFQFHEYLFIGFIIFHNSFQLIEPVIPHFSERPEPFRHFGQPLGIEAVVYLPSRLFLLKQPAFGVLKSFAWLSQNYRQSLPGSWHLLPVRPKWLFWSGQQLPGIHLFLISFSSYLTANIHAAI